MAQDSAYDIVQKYHRAWTGGDIETAMSYVADAITCRAPAECLTVADGKIVESVLIFDRLSYGQPEQD